ncbi:hypothetical protein EBL87_15190 [Cereibacter sphaeroides]|uniref:hypothetical protein n=1 Tax=Cereibacter sphaeroides TaxID=1063 RepID=UPI000F53A171|nr:hypothetical protein [Cereibacter sphaeroides]AZB65019.1 hypothetical protein EBL87_15190 [Cereibacter sphaeroides]AZB67097.1 hypothetical protein EBL86_01220 [Cereibacter sphaeroides]
MITIMRKVLVAEITAAIHLGAVADFWAAHARKRLGKLSQHFPQDPSCKETRESYRQDGAAEDERRSSGRFAAFGLGVRMALITFLLFAGLALHSACG